MKTALALLGAFTTAVVAACVALAIAIWALSRPDERPVVEQADAMGDERCAPGECVVCDGLIQPADPYTAVLRGDFETTNYVSPNR
jgi:hypothetical protein